MTMEAPLSKPVHLDRAHDLSAFACGERALDDYLRNYAWQNHQNRSARTYVTVRNNRVVGYYTLTAGSVRRDDTPPRVAKGQGNYPLPIILLARLAVDRTEQGKGLSAALLKDALLRAAQAAGRPHRLPGGPRPCPAPACPSFLP
jgi:GNAT superfamily N-acetyltransferase